MNHFIFFPKKHVNVLLRLVVVICIVKIGGLSMAQAQNGTISGRIYNALSNQALPFATLRLQETPYGTYSDSAGYFKLENLNPGLYNLEARYSGFETKVVYEIQVSNSKPYVLEIAMEESESEIDSVNIVASPFKTIEESPLSLQTIGTNEIKRYPGGNRDISRVIQALPGVNSSVSFRNDILIRGGGPSENRFYIDGIETPNINHFATQGASGGPVGLLNVDFIGEVDLYAGAFPANRGNALSSVLEFRQRAARDDRLGFTATVGASDLALTLEGPMGDNSSFLFSVRRSYLQLLFRLLDLPFLPTYNDFQYQQKIRLGTRHEITLVALGAIDEFELNLDANDTEYKRYLLANIPDNSQWNYTTGVNYKYFGDNGFWQFVVSRNHINYNAEKFLDNNPESTLLIDYTSQEIENKVRIERTSRENNWKWNYGINYEFAEFNTDSYFELRTGVEDFETEFGMHKYGAFGQLSRTLADDRLTLSLGARVDGNDFNSEMRNALNQFSPRFSASYRLTPKLNLSFNTGIYYQLPPYTVLGYRDPQSGELANDDVRYIRNQQLVLGLSYVTDRNTKLSVEGYYKDYDRYPFLLRDSVSLANVGADFGIFGNEAANSTSRGRTYGVEFLVQQRLYKGFYGIVAYTLGWSRFTDLNDNFVPSSWDSRHIISLTAGKKFGKNWEIGARWRFTSATPYTPADIPLSSLRRVWDVTQQEIPDYSRTNSERIDDFHQLDIRIDRKWFYEKWSLNLFIDIQNLYGYQIPGAPILDIARDEEGTPLLVPDDPSRYQTRFIEDPLGTVQPTIGIVVTY